MSRPSDRTSSPLSRFVGLLLVVAAFGLVNYRENQRRYAAMDEAKAAFLARSAAAIEAAKNTPRSPWLSPGYPWLRPTPTGTDQPRP